MLLAAFVLFLSPVMPNLDRNTDMNNTSTRYKPIIQFWRLSIANQGTHVRATLITKHVRTFELSFVFADEL